MTDRESDWDDPERVERWVARDGRRRSIQTAREMAAAIVGLETPPALVVELAAGPGTFLGTFLRLFPEARGVWSDRSARMQGHAQGTLAEFGERVSFLRSDMRACGISPRARVDVVLCARATHGLAPAELGPFYRQAAEILAPGGWLVNLDHVAVGEPWRRRYDALTPRFYEESSASRGGAKQRGNATLSDHTRALAEAGLAEADVPWRLLATVLLVARSSG